MMKELDQLVENFFQPKQDTLGLDQLVEMIEQVLSEKISNRGDVAEGILVAAAAAKLAARNPDGTISNITPQDIQAFVQKLSGQGAKVTSDYPNYSIRCKDKNVEDDTITQSSLDKRLASS
jgi:hypothetical protein